MQNGHNDFCSRGVFHLLAAAMLLFPTAAHTQPKIHVMYYSLFRADFESSNFFQWNGYRSWDGRLHDPLLHLGPETWRYDLALGSGRAGIGDALPILGALRQLFR